MSFYADAPSELLYCMPNVGQAVTAATSSGTAAGGPMLGGGAGGVASLISPCEIPHNYFSKQGKAIMIDGAGVYGVGSSIPTLKFGLYLDSALGAATGTALATTGAFTSADASAGRTAMGFNFRVWATCTGVGVSGTLQAWGWLNWGMIPSLTTTVTAPQITYYMGAGTTTPYSFNTIQTTPVYLEPIAFWSTATAGATITLTQMFVWGLN